jgi:hypothetical protein
MNEQTKRLQAMADLLRTIGKAASELATMLDDAQKNVPGNTPRVKTGKYSVGDRVFCRKCQDTVTLIKSAFPDGQNNIPAGMTYAAPICPKCKSCYCHMCEAL